MRKLPKEIVIGGHKLEIALDDTLVDESGKEVAVYGLMSFSKNKIILYSNMAWSKKESVLLHECLHEISRQKRLGLTEHQIGVLAEAIYELIKINKLSFSFKDDKYVNEKSEKKCRRSSKKT